MMKASQNCLEVIKFYEGFRANPYLCPAGVPTIGYGSTYYENGKKVSLKDPAITKERAESLLKNTVEGFEADVNSLLKIPVSQGQFDALVSFAFNVGSDIDDDTIAEGLGDSTLMKLVNGNIMATDSGWKQKISKQFMAWRWGRVKGKRQELPGLLARRSTEAFLFTDGVVKYFQSVKRK